MRQIQQYSNHILYSVLSFHFRWRQMEDWGQDRRRGCPRVYNIVPKFGPWINIFVPSYCVQQIQHLVSSRITRWGNYITFHRPFLRGKFFTWESRYDRKRKKTFCWKRLIIVRQHKIDYIKLAMIDSILMHDFLISLPRVHLHFSRLWRFIRKWDRCISIKIVTEYLCICGISVNFKNKLELKLICQIVFWT